MKKKKLSKKQKLIILFVSLFIVGVIAGIIYGVKKNNEKLEVETVTVTKDTINETLDVTGTVSAESESNFVMPEGAKVKSVNVQVGDIVKAGQVIATFDTSSLQEALAKKETAYETAQSAYVKAQKQSKTAESQINSVKSQISELENKIAQEEKTTTTTKETTTSAKTTTKSSVSVSDSLVKRFVTVAKLFGVEYSEDEARKVLVNALSAGSSVSDLKSVMDSMSSMTDYSNFDVSAFSSFDTSGITDELTLAQLKAQLTNLELQSSETYVETYKTVADKARQAYAEAQTQIEQMKNGWVAEDEGIVSEINIEAGSTTVNGETTKMDISSILSAVSSGSDVTSMLTSFFDTSTPAIKILQYPLIADISLNQYDVLNVELNQDVSIKSADGQIHSGKVSYISATASESSGVSLSSLMGSSGSSGSTIPAQVTIDNADKSIIVGTDVNVSIVTNTAENTTVVPVEAICIDGDDTFVYVYDEDKETAVKKTVTLGIFNDTYYQVTSGVSEGDILIKNTSGLEDGIKVTVR